MGQEASLPQGDGQEFDTQARAPPSSSNPPALGTAAASSSASSSSRNHNPRAAGKMIGAVFHKATNRGGGGESSSARNLGGGGGHNNGGMRYPPETGGQHPAYGVNGSTNGSHPVPSPQGVISPGMSSPARPQQQQQPQTLHMTPEQQQQYYHQQQQMYQMQQQQQQQQSSMMQNQFYHPQQAQQYLVSPQQPLPPAQQQQMLHGLDPSMMGTYNAQGSNNNHGTNTASAKKGMGFKGNGRGAAIINSMRNLSLTGAMQRSNPTSPARTVSGGKQQVNEWETRWDEDEDDSDGDDAAPPLGANLQQQQQQQQPMMQQLQQRPGIDMAHSTTSPTSSNRPNPSTMMMSSNDHHLNSSTSSDLLYGSPLPLQHQQQQQLSGMAPGQLQQPHITKAHLVTATPEPADSLLAHQQYPSQQKQRPHPPSAGATEDGIEWDTGAYQAEGREMDEKPNVQMFMPLLRVLGKGSFGKVVLVQKQIGKERGALFAMKILRKTHLVKRRQIERTRTERKVLSVVNHPFIMKLHYAFQSPDKLYLVLDYCPGGELFFHLSRFRRFPERVARFYAAELLLAIGHLHKRGIIYRDLKPENVLLDADGHVKLGDFGLAKAGIKHPCEGATSMCGTPEYMAPEVLSQHGHGFCVDYWGLGMLIYEMMTGLPPWYTTDRAKLFRRLKSAPLDIPTYFSAQAANCVSALLERNPRRRLGVTGIRTAMEHEFFRSISWRSLYGKRVEAPIRPCEGWAPPSGETTPGGGMNNGAAPHSNSTMENMNSNELDAATANFDNTFTRMPVETEDRTHDDLSDEGEIEELHEDTFVGFTFDDDKDRDDVATASAFQQSASSSSSSLRPRSHPTQNAPASPTGASSAGSNAYGSNGSFTRHID